MLQSIGRIFTVLLILGLLLSTGIGHNTKDMGLDAIIYIIVFSTIIRGLFFRRIKFLGYNILMDLIFIGLFLLIIYLSNKFDNDNNSSIFFFFGFLYYTFIIFIFPILYIHLKKYLFLKYNIDIGNKKNYALKEWSILSLGFILTCYFINLI